MRRSRPTVSVVLQRLSDAAFDALSAVLIARLTAAINRNTGRLIFLFGLATPLSAPAMQVMVETRSDCASVPLERVGLPTAADTLRSVEHTSELHALMRTSYSGVCLIHKTSV